METKIKNFTKTVATLTIFAASIPAASYADSLQITSINIAAACKAELENPKTEKGCKDSNVVYNMRRELVDQARSAHSSDYKGVVYALQEVDVNNDRNPGWDMPSYFSSRLNKYASGARYSDWEWSSAFAGDSYKNGLYGISTISSLPVTKSQARQTVIRDTKWNNNSYLATKMVVGTERFWIINTHLSTEPLIAAFQLEEIVDFALTLDRKANIIILGDMNIYKNGLHESKCKTQFSASAVAPYSPSEINCGAQLAAYKRLDKIFSDAGFEDTEEASNTKECWLERPNTGCTFKATGAASVQLDYAYILKRNSRMTTSVTKEKFERQVDEGLLVLTDHYALTVSVEWD